MPQNLSTTKNLSTLPGFMIVLALIIIGSFIYKDYGVSWDEPAMRKIGLVNLRVVETGNAMPKDFRDIDHGAAFELPLVFIERALGITDLQSITRLRHCCSFLFYATGIFCGYLLALRLFRKQWLALLGTAMLILEPRIFAHSFFNTKDVPFLTAMLIALCALYIAFEKGRAYHFALAGMLCGYATGIRTMGALLVILSAIFLIADIVKAENAHSKRKALWHLILFSGASLLMLYLSWPALWYSPMEILVLSISKFSHYTAWTGSLTFNGERYPGSALPWYYVPEWFCISTPIVWLLSGVAGLLIGLARFIKSPLAVAFTSKGRLLFLCAVCFALPVLAVILLHSVVYDDWRHLYFIYPPFVMLALYGIERISSNRRARAAVIVSCVVQAVATAGFMIMAHPFQQVYFNPIVSHKPEYLRYNFDYEYWGTSFKQALEYLVKHDDRDSIPVVDTWFPLAANQEALAPEIRGRFRWTNTSEQGAYLITNYRGDPPEQPFPKVWGIKVGGSTVIQIYRVDTNLRK